jgi:hypothetical protein
VTVTITAAERDALYEHIYMRLSGIGDVWLAVEAEDFETAERLGRDFSDDLRLVLDDLGWGEGGGGLELRTPPDVLRRVFRRVSAAAEAERAGEERERLEVHAREQQAAQMIETCRRVLAELGD